MKQFAPGIIYGELMFKQYDIVIMCSEELHKSSLASNDKIRLETLLIYVKQSLLDEEVKARLKGVPNSERKIMDLYGRVLHLCSPDGKPNEVDKLIITLLEIKSYMRHLYFQAFH
jgi:hypothetical protein